MVAADAYHSPTTLIDRDAQRGRHARDRLETMAAVDFLDLPRSAS
jgi:hypothetical protein